MVPDAFPNVKNPPDIKVKQTRSNKKLRFSITDFASVMISFLSVLTFAAADDGGILGFFHQLGIDETRLKKIWKSNLPVICDDGAYDIIQFGRYRTEPKRV